MTFYLFIVVIVSQTVISNNMNQAELTTLKIEFNKLWKSS